MNNPTPKKLIKYLHVKMLHEAYIEGAMPPPLYRNALMNFANLARVYLYEKPMSTNDLFDFFIDNKEGLLSRDWPTVRTLTLKLIELS